MPTFAANLSMMYKEVEFLNRFAAAASDGFEFVEYLFPYDYKISQIQKQLTTYKLKQSLFNLPPGNWDAGDRGIAALPGREAEFIKGLDLAIEYANELNCKKLHIMAGICPKELQTPEGFEIIRKTYIGNLKIASQRLAGHGITALIEPINNRDMPGYFLNYQEQAINILNEVNEPNLKIQMDLYHVQIMEGDIETKLRKNLSKIGHIQIANVPKRNEPDEIGEINFPYLFRLIDEIGYQGEVGCEYIPRAKTSENIKWIKPWL